MGALRDSNPNRTVTATDSPDEAPVPKRPRRRRGWWRLFWLVLLIAVILLGVAASREMRNAKLQAREISRFARDLDYSMAKGPSDSMLYPGAGPFDKRLGYSDLELFLGRLTKRGYLIEAQARFSPALLDYSKAGFFVPYAEKIQAGLSITDCRGTDLYQYNYPQLSTATLCELLGHSAGRGQQPAVHREPRPARPQPAPGQPGRGLAALRQGGAVADCQGPSTLATQLEKYRHSPDGLTLSGGEKIRQMISASVRAYLGGPQTLEVRQNVVRDYLNSVPLSAVPGHGEVHGLAEGLRVWYGADFAEVNTQLHSTAEDPQSLAKRGLALRENWPN